MRTGTVAFFGVIFCLCISQAFAKADIELHDPNFYLFSKAGEVFYPYAANVSVLMDPKIEDSQVEDTLSRLAAGGINTVRVVVDKAFSPDMRIEHYEEFDGRLQSTIVDRLDAIVKAAEKHDLYVIVCFFDLQRIAMNWDQHPHNAKNGGSCQNLHEFLTNGQLLSRSLQRTRQLVNRFQGRNILAWEIARGVNIWSHFEGLEYRPLSQYLKAVQFWLIRLLHAVNSTDEEDHLTAICCTPNTLPDRIHQLPFDIHFLQIYSSKDPEQIAKSVPPLLEIGRKFKKPIFIAEYDWNVPETEWESINNAGFWCALASNSAAFFTAREYGGLVDLHPSEYKLLESAQVFLYNVNLAGRPRPPLEAPAEAFPKGSYKITQSMVGNDWIYWIVRDNPGESQARLVFHSIEGLYEFFWMDLEESIRGEHKEFKSNRIKIQMQTPTFERSILGRLRLKEVFRDKKEQPQNRIKSKPSKQ